MKSKITEKQLRAEFIELMASDPDVGMFGASIDDARKELLNIPKKDWSVIVTDNDINLMARRLKREG